MTLRLRIALPALTALLWFVPSVGTQGMGTIGQRVVHPDAALVDPVPTDPGARELASADARVEAAIR